MQVTTTRLRSEVESDRDPWAACHVVATVGKLRANEFVIISLNSTISPTSHMVRCRCFDVVVTAS